jgi:outer membrane protein assembly factor BamD (BamD/ComL family)
MKKALITLVLALLLAACSDSARDLYDSAQFEEKQRNYEHAAELYEEIIQKYPASDYAPLSKERLNKIKGTAQ